MAEGIDFVFQQTRSKCQACGSTMTARIDNPETKGCYMSHPTYGISLVSCLSCKMRSVEFVHPKVVSQYFESSVKNYSSESLVALHKYQTELCQRQAEYFVKALEIKREKLLIVGAGRSLYSQFYNRVCQQLFLIELIPAFRDWATTQPDILLLYEKDLQRESLFDTFDTIILTNVLQRTAFPKALLARCSRLLRTGGELAFDVPITSLESLEKGQFGGEEINFFSEESVNSLILNQGSFEIKSIFHDSVLRNDPSTVFPYEQVKNPRGSTKVILTNERPTRERIILDYEREQLEYYLKSLSFGVFVVANNIGSWAGSSDTETPAPKHDLDPQNFFGH